MAFLQTSNLSINYSQGETFDGAVSNTEIMGDVRITREEETLVKYEKKNSEIAQVVFQKSCQMIHTSEPLRWKLTPQTCLVSGIMLLSVAR